jgi:hypothetical protein
MTTRRDGDHIQVGDITSSGGIAIGRGANATFTGSINAGAAKDVDPDALRAALKELRSALRQSGLPEDAGLEAETAAGAAAIEGVKNGQVKPEAVVERVQQVGETLKGAKVAIEEGSDLWQSVLKLAPLVGPLVQGGAKAVGAWFGVPIPV